MKNLKLILNYIEKKWLDLNNIIFEILEAEEQKKIETKK